MITNERQYRITKGEIERFEQALAKVGEQNKTQHPKMRKAMRAGMESQLQELREEVAEYEALRDGKVTSLEFDSLASVPIGLIKARIAKGLTQKDLAQALHLKEQQIQRYEATLYEGAGLDRIQEVANVLGVRERVKLELSKS
jgi:ribosome-binding protein aMBF1 (putative translation factor)